jgi:hypothetical protein
MKLVNSILKKETGRGLKEWLDFIGEDIGKRSKPLKGSNGLWTTDVDLWLSDLARELWKTVPSRHDLNCKDENIICARLMALILAAWSCRIIRAKAYDPRRPVAARRKALGKLGDHCKALLECVADESMDCILFPSQEWDSPFSPHARYEPDEVELKRQAYAKKVGKK